ncbi:MAG: hypothetical protein J5595_03590 [Bacteroidales bacterium]|nr:hypothetical protein [Bacteroidales bacterium]
MQLFEQVQRSVPVLWFEPEQQSVPVLWSVWFQRSVPVLVRLAWLQFPAWQQRVA